MAEERITPSEVGPHNIIEYREHLARYEFAVPFVKKGAIGLDIACGSGYGTDLLIRKGAEKFYGVDISPEAIKYAKEHFRCNGLEYIQSDALQIKFIPNYFDLIASFESIEHLKRENGEKFIEILHNLLKKEGILILSCPNRDTYPENYDKNPFHLYEYSFAEILGLLKKYFPNIIIYCQEIRYFNKFYKKTTQFLKHLPGRFVTFLTDLARNNYARLKDIKKVNILFRLLLYQYHFKHSVFPFIEDYRKCKPVFFILVCEK